MDLARLQQLKQNLIHEESLAQVWLFFMDHFADHPEFIAMGEDAHHPFVEAVVAQIGRQLFAEDGAITGLILCRVPEHHFFHGGFSMGGRVGALIYFEDVQVGLIMVTDTPPSVEVKYARFTGKLLRPQGIPSRN